MHVYVCACACIFTYIFKKQTKKPFQLHLPPSSLLHSEQVPAINCWSVLTLHLEL